MKEIKHHTCKIQLLKKDSNLEKQKRRKKKEEKLSKRNARSAQEKKPGIGERIRRYALIL